MQAADGQEAIDAFKQGAGSFQIILLDVQMPIKVCFAVPSSSSSRLTRYRTTGRTGSSIRDPRARETSRTHAVEDSRIDRIVESEYCRQRDVRLLP